MYPSYISIQTSRLFGWIELNALEPTDAHKTTSVSHDRADLLTPNPKFPDKGTMPFVLGAVVMQIAI